MLEHRTDQDITEQKEQQRGGTQTAGLRDKIDGDRQTRNAGKNEGLGSTQRIDKMDAEANSQEGKTRNREGGGFQWLQKRS